MAFFVEALLRSRSLTMHMHKSLELKPVMQAFMNLFTSKVTVVSAMAETPDWGRFGNKTLWSTRLVVSRNDKQM